MKRTTLSALLVIAAAAIVLAVVPANGGAAPPDRFYGLQSWDTPTRAELDRMVALGAEVYRTNFFWYVVEPHRGDRNWGPMDALMANAAQAGIDVLPVLAGPPRWASHGPQREPTKPRYRKAWAHWVQLTVERYGHDGTFWQEHPELPPRPIRAWQVWNEPNFGAYWWRRPSAADYVKYLKLTRKAIKKADSSARVVVAGIAETLIKKRGIEQLKFIRGMYKVRGFRSAGDILAIHVYSKSYKGVMTQLRKVRDIMRRNHDRKKTLWLTEVGWATSAPKHNKRPWVTTKKGQAKQLRALAKAMMKKRRAYRLKGMIWFSWKDKWPPPADQPNWWALHTGLLTKHGKAKPALKAYARAAGGTTQPPGGPR